MYAGFELYENGFGNGLIDSRVPDLLNQVQPGVAYTFSETKTSEHGGINSDDVSVTMLISNPSMKQINNTVGVSTRQVAVTALRALGLSSSQLDGALIKTN